MEPILYDDHFDTGIIEIDAEHRHLLDAVNKLLDNEARRDFQFAVETVDGMREDAIRHFSHEEMLMEQSGYWGRRSHHEEHRRLLTQFDEYMHRLKENAHTWHAGTLALYMADWLLHHINGADRTFGQWYLKYGEKPEMKMFNEQPSE
jgi:hemerythrin